MPHVTFLYELSLIVTVSFPVVRHAVGAAGTPGGGRPAEQDKVAGDSGGELPGPAGGHERGTGQ